MNKTHNSSMLMDVNDLAALVTPVGQIFHSLSVVENERDKLKEQCVNYQKQLKKAKCMLRKLQADQSGKVVEESKKELDEFQNKYFVDTQALNQQLAETQQQLEKAQNELEKEIKKNKKISLGKYSDQKVLTLKDKILTLEVEVDNWKMKHANVMSQLEQHSRQNKLSVMVNQKEYKTSMDELISLRKNYSLMIKENMCLKEQESEEIKKLKSSNLACLQEIKTQQMKIANLSFKAQEAAKILTTAAFGELHKKDQSQSVSKPQHFSIDNLNNYELPDLGSTKSIEKTTSETHNLKEPFSIGPATAVKISMSAKDSDSECELNLDEVVDKILLEMKNLRPLKPVTPIPDSPPKKRMFKRKMDKNLRIMQEVTSETVNLNSEIHKELPKEFSLISNQHTTLDELREDVTMVQRQVEQLTETQKTKITKMEEKQLETSKSVNKMAKKLQMMTRQIVRREIQAHFTKRNLIMKAKLKKRKGMLLKIGRSRGRRRSRVNFDPTLDEPCCQRSIDSGYIISDSDFDCFEEDNIQKSSFKEPKPPIPMLKEEPTTSSFGDVEIEKSLCENVEMCDKRVNILDCHILYPGQKAFIAKTDNCDKLEKTSEDTKVVQEDESAQEKRNVSFLLFGDDNLSISSDDSDVSPIINHQKSIAKDFGISDNSNDCLEESKETDISEFSTLKKVSNAESTNTISITETNESKVVPSFLSLSECSQVMLKGAIEGDKNGFSYEANKDGSTVALANESLSEESKRDECSSFSVTNNMVSFECETSVPGPKHSEHSLVLMVQDGGTSNFETPNLLNPAKSPKRAMEVYNKIIDGNIQESSCLPGTGVVLSEDNEEKETEGSSKKSAVENFTKNDRSSFPIENGSSVVEVSSNNKKVLSLFSLSDDSEEENEGACKKSAIDGFPKIDRSSFLNQAKESDGLTGVAKVSTINKKISSLFSISDDSEEEIEGSSWKPKRKEESEGLPGSETKDSYLEDQVNLPDDSESSSDKKSNPFKIEPLTTTMVIHDGILQNEMRENNCLKDAVKVLPKTERLLSPFSSPEDTEKTLKMWNRNNFQDKTKDFYQNELNGKQELYTSEQTELNDRDGSGKATEDRVSVQELKITRSPDVGVNSLLPASFYANTKGCTDESANGNTSSFAVKSYEKVIEHNLYKIGSCREIDSKDDSDNEAFVIDFEDGLDLNNRKTRNSYPVSTVKDHTMQKHPTAVVSDVDNIRQERETTVEMVIPIEQVEMDRVNSLCGSLSSSLNDIDETSDDCKSAQKRTLRSNKNNALMPNSSKSPTRKPSSEKRKRSPSDQLFSKKKKFDPGAPREDRIQPTAVTQLSENLPNLFTPDNSTSIGEEANFLDVSLKPSPRRSLRNLGANKETAATIQNIVKIVKQQKEEEPKVVYKRTNSRSKRKITTCDPVMQDLLGFDHNQEMVMSSSESEDSSKKNQKGLKSVIPKMEDEAELVKTQCSLIFPEPADESDSAGLSSDDDSLSSIETSRNAALEYEKIKKAEKAVLMFYEVPLDGMLKIVLSHFDTKVLCKVVVRFSTEDIECVPIKPNNPMAPILSNHQVILLRLLIAMTKKDENTKSIFLDLAEEVIFTIKSPTRLEPIARLHVAYMKYYCEIVRAKSFIFASLAKMGKLALPYLYFLAISWLEVFATYDRLQGSDRLLAHVIITLIKIKDVKEPEYYQFPLMKLLNLVHHYPTDIPPMKFLITDIIKEYKETECEKLKTILLVICGSVQGSTFYKWLILSLNEVEITSDKEMNVVLDLLKYLICNLRVFRDQSTQKKFNTWISAHQEKTIYSNSVKLKMDIISCKF